MLLDILTKKVKVSWSKSQSISVNILTITFASVFNYEIAEALKLEQLPKGYLNN